eukprot:jgi/Chlat1/8761/Chrsp90S08123
MARSVLSLPVLLVLGLFGFIYCSVTFWAILPWLSFSAPGILHLGLFSSLTVASLLSYFVAVLTPAGSVPWGWSPELEDASSSLREVKRKGGDLRYCQKCCHYKPMRAHHCRVCNRCVLRMDHHCAWINNCVGHGNYKPFVLFLLYTSASLWYALVLLVTRGIHALSEPDYRSARDQDDAMASEMLSALVQAICATFTFPLAIVLAVLLGWHFYLISQNKTTIEYHEGVRAKVLAAHGSAGSPSATYYPPHPYNLGFCLNLHQVLGENPTAWFLPSSKAEGNGLSFATLH